MLGDARVQPMIAVTDLPRAVAFYTDTLGLTKVEEFADVAVTFQAGGGTNITVYHSEFAGTNKATAAAWVVDDVDGVVEQLESRGVTFEHYDDMTGGTVEGDAYVMGHMRVAWFKDPDGNIFSVGNS